MELTINGSRHQVDIEPDTPLLWVLRDELGMTGTKYGCGLAQCGACTVLVDGQATRSCVTPVESVAGSEIMTIEAITEDPVGQKVVEAWVSNQGTSMRLLSVGPGHGRDGAHKAESSAERRGHCRRNDQSLSLWHL